MAKRIFSEYSDSAWTYGSDRACDMDDGSEVWVECEITGLGEWVKVEEESNS